MVRTFRMAVANVQNGMFHIALHPLGTWHDQVAWSAIDRDQMPADDHDHCLLAD